MAWEPRVRRGERAPNAALSDAQVKRIREMAAADYSARQIKATLELTCSLKTIYNAINRSHYREAG